jgi:phospholipid transport system substrate-binding protein
MLKKYVVLMLSFLTSCGVLAAAPDTSDPYAMMKQVSDQTFARLKAEQANIRQDPNSLKVVVEQELMPYVNEQYAALKLLGSNLKGAKREDVQAFIVAFRAYLVTNYAQVLTQYSDQQIIFGPKPTIEPTDRISSIDVDIVNPGAPNIRLQFKLRKEKSGAWKAYDMIAEGISLLSSKQSEWSGKIRQEGILAVAAELQTLSEQPIKFESATQ